MVIIVRLPTFTSCVKQNELYIRYSNKFVIELWVGLTNEHRNVRFVTFKNACNA